MVESYDSQPHHDHEKQASPESYGTFQLGDSPTQEERQDMPEYTLGMPPVYHSEQAYTQQWNIEEIMQKY